MDDKTYPVNEVDKFLIDEFIRELSSSRRRMDRRLQVLALLFPLESYLKQLQESFDHIQTAIDILESIKTEVENENISS